MRSRILVLVSLVVVDSSQRCTHPKAEAGYQVTEGCLQRICKAGVWRTSLASNLCCYDNTAYTINTTISSSMSEDMCVRTTIDCVEETQDQAKMILTMKNYCEKYATQEQMEEIKSLLIKNKKAKEGCRKEDPEKKAP